MLPRGIWPPGTMDPKMLTSGLDGISLLLGHSADDGQLELLIVEGLEHEKQREHKKAKAKERIHDEQQQIQYWNHRNHHQCDADCNACTAKEEALKRMEAHKLVLVEWFDEQEQDRRDDG